jgi:hypothetical protein
MFSGRNIKISSEKNAMEEGSTEPQEGMRKAGEGREIERNGTDKVTERKIAPPSTHPPTHTILRLSQ